MGTEMTAEAIQRSCKEHKLYKTPSLNDKLYLNFQGFHTIENLEPYTGVRALFLEGNALDSLRGIPLLPELKCLFVQQNMIWEIDGLEHIQELDTLNVSSNNISRLQNLSHLTKLCTLICTNNRLGSVDSIAHLAECKSLAVLDLSNNRIEGKAEDLLSILSEMPKLTCLYLKGNPIVSQVKNYRKTLICALKGLKYLDDRPIFELERLCAEAWSRDGLEGEREARRVYREQEEAKDKRNHEYLANLRQDGIRKRRERMGLEPDGEDPCFEDMSDGEWEEAEEPPELVKARQRLAQYSARVGEEEPLELSVARKQLVREGISIKEASRGMEPVERFDSEDESEVTTVGDGPGKGNVTNMHIDMIDDASTAQAGDTTVTGEHGHGNGSGPSAESFTHGFHSLGGHKVEVMISEDCADVPAPATFSGNLDDLD